MMPATPRRSWKEDFERASDIRDEIYRREQLARFEARERERQKNEERENDLRDMEMFALVQMAFASPEQVADFKLQLDDYDAKTVEALIENVDALKMVQQRLDDMLDQAYTLPDGRKVFKTKDGQRVFDEHGQELSVEVVDPKQIDDRKPAWETFMADVEERKRLQIERGELLEYQDKLDTARARLDNGEITTKELDALKGDLEKSMPDAVRAKVGNDRPEAENTNSQKLESNAPVLPNNMDALMRQTGFGGPSGP
ncbi:hypothetical protein DEM27_16200 [Metarhizobium album]|uniref:Uncharacterized protein n=1 Tax=Metarhizobium album TaxID=2182425 RepID=A0A2U2DNW0_9HYPH|nr:hypothetical protein [Rhizobium album]PWE54997.1 hypothetical protein DEM27_16200 [Rhizobium album]